MQQTATLSFFDGIKLFGDQRMIQKIVGVVIGPIVGGSIACFLLGQSMLLYWPFIAICVAGGVLGGFEHANRVTGLGRGVSGGFIFTVAFIVVLNTFSIAPLMEVPANSLILFAINCFVGAIAGVFGAYLRQKRSA